MKAARRTRQERLMYVLSPILLLALWELMSRSGLLDRRFFPPPTDIISTFINMLLSGELLRQTGITLMRTLAGFLAGGVSGVVLGIAMGRVIWLRALLKPIADALYPVPKIAVMPLFLLILGVGDASKIAVVATGVFFPMLYNTLVGVLEIPQIYLDVGHIFGAKGWKFFMRVALPGALPLITTGIKVASGIALVLIVSAEFVNPDTGLGAVIFNSWQVFAVEQMFVGLVMVALLGYVTSVLIEEVERVLIPWRTRT